MFFIMPIISKEIEIQEGLASVYDSLLDKIDNMKMSLSNSRNTFKNACKRFIENGFNTEDEWIKANELHETKFLEYDIYCHIQEIINDFKDLHGQFPEYYQMYRTLDNIMLQFAHQEEYELAAMIKLWVDRIKAAIRETN